MKIGEGRKSTRAPEHQSTRVAYFLLLTSYFLLPTSYFLLLISGCAYKRVEKVEYQPASLNLIVESLRERSKKIIDLRGIANIHIVSPKMSQRVKEAIVVNGDSHIRLESLNIMGNPSLIMVSDGNIVTAYNVHENRFYRGIASPEIISRMTGIYMSPDDIINLITGRHFAEYLQIEDSGYAKGNGVYILKTQGEGGFYDEIWIEPANFSPKTVKRYDSNGKVVRFITFSDYRKIGDYLFPFKTNVLLPSQKISMTIEYTDVELNGGVEESLFDLIVPDDAEAIEVSE